jgi:lipopolysaccharide transport system permease protein
MVRGAAHPHLPDPDVDLRTDRQYLYRWHATVFVLPGRNTLWLYFSESFNNTAKTFKDNENIFGKVYFPRLIMPLSKVIGGLIKFAIQFTFFLIVYFYLYYKGATIQPQKEIILLPLLLVLMAGYGLGAGIIFSSLTTKYRDLTFLLQFGVQLLMYASSVIVPFSAVPEKYKPLIAANPLVHIIETFKYMFLGAGYFTWEGLAYAFGVMVVLLFTGIIIFNRTEKTFMDTV